MTTRWARVARGMLAAVFAVFVAALFHVAAGGAPPSLLAVAVSLGLGIPTCVLLTGRRLSLWRLSLSVGLSQVLFHTLFTLSPAGTAFHTADGSTHVHAGSHLIASGTASMDAMAGMPDSGWMWLGHATAALITVIALRYGEAAAWGLLTTAAIRIVAFAELTSVGPARPAAPHRVAVDARPIVLPPPRLVLGGMRHRGPPATVSACA